MIVVTIVTTVFIIVLNNIIVLPIVTMKLTIVLNNSIVLTIVTLINHSVEVYNSKYYRADEYDRVADSVIEYDNIYDNKDS